MHRSPRLNLVAVALVATVLLSACVDASANGTPSADNPAATAVPEYADARIEACGFDASSRTPDHGVMTVGADPDTGLGGETIFVAFSGSGRSAATTAGLDPSEGVVTSATLCIEGVGGAQQISCGEYLFTDQGARRTTLWIEGHLIETSWLADGTQTALTTTTIPVHGPCPDEYTTTTSTYGGVDLFSDRDPFNDTRGASLDESNLVALADHMTMRASVAADDTPLPASTCSALSDLPHASGHLATWNTEAATFDDGATAFTRIEPPRPEMVTAADQLADMAGEWAVSLPEGDETLGDPITFLWLTALLDFPTVLTHIDPIEDATDEEAQLMLLGLSGRHGLMTSATDIYPMRDDYLTMIEEAVERRCP